MPEVLLDLLAQRTGHFISDFRREPQLSGELFAILEALSWEDYSLKQWSSCLEYLLGRPVQVESYQALGELLKNPAQDHHSL